MRRTTRWPLGLQSRSATASLLPRGSFVFVVSDFLDAVPADVWLRLRAFALGRGAGRRAGPRLGADVPRGRRRRPAASPIQRPAGSRMSGSARARPATAREQRTAPRRAGGTVPPAGVRSRDRRLQRPGRDRSRFRAWATRRRIARCSGEALATGGSCSRSRPRRRPHAAGQRRRSRERRARRPVPLYRRGARPARPRHGAPTAVRSPASRRRGRRAPAGRHGHGAREQTLMCLDRGCAPRRRTPRRAARRARDAGDGTRRPRGGPVTVVPRVPEGPSPRAQYRPTRRRGRLARARSAAPGRGRPRVRAARGGARRVSSVAPGGRRPVRRRRRARARAPPAARVGRPAGADRRRAADFARAGRQRGGNAPQRRCGSRGRRPSHRRRRRGARQADRGARRRR